MTTSKPSAAPRKASDDNNLFSAMYEFQETSLGPMRMLGEAWLSWSTELGAEVTRFVSDRLKEDVRTQHAILHCKDPSELQEIQFLFLQKAVADYSAETGRIVELGPDVFERVAKANAKAD